MKKIFILFLSLTIVIFIIHSCDYRLWMLKKDTLSYKELPEEIKKCLANKLDSFDLYNNIILFVNESDSSNFKAESISTIFGPKSWIADIKIIDIRKNKVYRINREASEPYILFENKLYIPNEYNITWKYDKITYNVYNLK